MNKVTGSRKKKKKKSSTGLPATQSKEWRWYVKLWRHKCFAFPTIFHSVPSPPTSGPWAADRIKTQPTRGCRPQRCLPTGTFTSAFPHADASQPVPSSSFRSRLPSLQVSTHNHSPLSERDPLVPKLKSGPSRLSPYPQILLPSPS